MAEEQKTKIHQYENGLVLLGKEMPWSEAVSYSMMIPSGAVFDGAGKEGVARMVTELTSRGAGEYDNRSLLNAFEDLGVDSSESTGLTRSGYRATMLADKFSDAIALTADMILRPTFPEEEIEPAVLGLLQEIASIEDEPPLKMRERLFQNFRSGPWARAAYGVPDSLRQLTVADLQDHHRKYFSPQGAFIGLAGRFDWDQAVERVGELFGAWRGEAHPLPASVEGTVFSDFIEYDSSQTQIGLIWAAPAPTDALSRAYRMGLSILSGGMSSRLFTEVREKRGLCYSVYASYAPAKVASSSVYCYCGSGNQTAQNALDVIVEQLNEIVQNGVQEEEFQRMKTRLKCDLIIGLESVSSRASHLVNDWFFLDRVREMEELQREVDSLTREQVNEALRAHPFGPLHLVVLGPEPLKIDSSLLG